MQPWHQMQKQGTGDNDSDDGIFNRHKQENDVHKSAGGYEEEEESNPAVLDGGILLLDAAEAVQSIMDDDVSSRRNVRAASDVVHGEVLITEKAESKQHLSGAAETQSHR